MKLLVLILGITMCAPVFGQTGFATPAEDTATEKLPETKSGVFDADKYDRTKPDISAALELVNDHTQRLDLIEQRLDAHDLKFAAVEKRLIELESRLSSMPKASVAKTYSTTTGGSNGTYSQASYQSAPVYSTLSSGSGGSVTYSQSYSSQPTIVSSSGPSWTYPGDITSHLASGHGVSGAGMSHAQQVALHNQLHNGQTTSTSFRTPVRTATQRVFTPATVVNVSNCPGGVCPPQQSVTRVRLRTVFGR